MDGRKIPPEFENPLDNLFISFTQKMNPIYKYLNFTPNILTTLSLLTTILGLYLYTKGYIVTGACLNLIGYYFDCADGNFSRKYNQQTDFGDFYDHISDIFKLILLAYVLLFKSNISNKTIKFICIVFLVSLVILFIHIGCQERIYVGNESNSLNKTKHFCPDKRMIKYTKIIGGGGGIHFLAFFILIFLKNIDDYINGK